MLFATLASSRNPSVFIALSVSTTPSSVGLDQVLASRLPSLGWSAKQVVTNCIITRFLSVVRLPPYSKVRT